MMTTDRDLGKTDERGVLPRFTLSELAALAEERIGPCATLYLGWPGAKPTDRAEASVRLRKLISRLEERLGTAGGPAAETLDRVSKLAAAAGAITSTGGGIAIFAAPGFERIVRVDKPVDDRVVVGPRFHLLPLVFALRPTGDVWILAISENGSRLIRSRPDGTTDVTIPDAPTSLEDSARYDVHTRDIQSHSGSTSPSGGERHSTIFHGHGAAKDSKEVELARYARLVARAAGRLFATSRPILVFAGVEKILSLVRSSLDVGFIDGGTIAGSPDRIGDEELVRSARAITQPLVGERNLRIVEEFPRLRSRDRASADPSTILDAALSGRVERIIFTDRDGPQGRYDPHSRRLEFGSASPASAPGNEVEDIANLALTLAVRTGAEPVWVPADRVPFSESFGATMRY
jgi:hypothetical protein